MNNMKAKYLVMQPIKKTMLVDLAGFVDFMFLIIASLWSGLKLLVLRELPVVSRLADQLCNIFLVKRRSLVKTLIFTSGYT